MQGLLHIQRALGQGPTATGDDPRVVPRRSRRGPGSGEVRCNLRRSGDERHGVGRRGAIGAQRSPHFAAAGKIQDPQDVRHMVADGKVRQAQFATDFLVRQTVQQKVENLLLPQRQQRDGRLRAAPLLPDIAIDMQLRKIDDFRSGEGRSDTRYGIFTAMSRYGDENDGAVIPFGAAQRRVRGGIE